LYPFAATQRCARSSTLTQSDFVAIASFSIKDLDPSLYLSQFFHDIVSEADLMNQKCHGITAEVETLLWPDRQ
jgi:hypothetical protein